MSLLLTVLMAVGGLAVIVEVLNLVARDFFGGGRAQETIKESIRKTQSEIRAADKKLDSLRTTRRGVLTEFERAANKIEELEKQMRRAPDVPPALIHTLASTAGSGTRYRAKITKTLPADADEHQTLLWKHESFLDVTAAGPDDARDAARRQFPEGHGYTIGPFAPVSSSVESAA
jgi:hypothetical protein